MKTFYLTFGQQYPWKDGWVEVEAPDYETAREYVVKVFENKWSHLCTKNQFRFDLFPAGKIGETIK